MIQILIEQRPPSEISIWWTGIGNVRELQGGRVCGARGLVFCNERLNEIDRLGKQLVEGHHCVTGVGV